MSINYYFRKWRNFNIAPVVGEFAFSGILGTSCFWTMPQLFQCDLECWPNQTKEGLGQLLPIYNPPTVTTNDNLELDV